jgi:hypothetical protein
MIGVGAVEPIGRFLVTGPEQASRLVVERERLLARAALPIRTSRLQGGQEVAEVVFHARKIHLVQENEMRLLRLVAVSLQEQAEEVGAVIRAIEMVMEAQKPAVIGPVRTDRDEGEEAPLCESVAC